MVLSRLDKEFDSLSRQGASTIQRMIEKCARKAEELYRDAKEEEDVEDDGSDEENSEFGNDEDIASTVSELSALLQDDTDNDMEDNNECVGV